MSCKYRREVENRRKNVRSLKAKKENPQIAGVEEEIL